MNPALSTLVASAEQGDRAAADTLFSSLYDELHRMARRELLKRGAGVTLGATTLLHEAYLDMSDREGAAFPDRNRFMGYASRVMRGLIIDYARPAAGAEARRRVRDHLDLHRCGGGRLRCGADELGRVSEALDELEATDRDWRVSSI